MKKLYIVIILLSTSQTSTSQYTISESTEKTRMETHAKGYIIMESGDTIHGFLRKLDDVGSAISVLVRDENGEDNKMDLKKVSAYKRGESVYIKKKFSRPGALNIGTFYRPTSKGFMNLISDGRVKLYRFTYIQRTPRYNGSKVAGYNESVVRDYYLEMDGELILVKKWKFKKRMSAYFSDNPEISDKIEYRVYRYNNLESIVYKYNKDFEDLENEFKGNAN